MTRRNQRQAKKRHDESRRAGKNRNGPQGNPRPSQVDSSTHSNSQHREDLPSHQSPLAQGYLSSQRQANDGLSLPGSIPMAYDQSHTQDAFVSRQPRILQGRHSNGQLYNPGSHQITQANMVTPSDIANANAIGVLPNQGNLGFQHEFDFNNGFSGLAESTSILDGHIFPDIPPAEINPYGLQKSTANNFDGETGYEQTSHSPRMKQELKEEIKREVVEEITSNVMNLITSKIEKWQKDTIDNLLPPILEKLDEFQLQDDDDISRRLANGSETRNQDNPL
ncbi:hypothetical protein FOXG_12490 [Fusarium oxysporum f. sp. lycopersici 4287]|uniref:Uncharacterized protein n=1 Tax=Fusarium oxysporum f. sp. lycopersici (strain 4287 / CBS 123668 / FGSC 9935 / NRRL 34936) TaxID=426428 RepID=A0A0J9VT39_FUSO4|nr:hypothetical protein FOXG_12490 [Fusarium oxysporum f. sp. lycopersici 4287]XP_018251860.1 hypothetical protein FOXG_12490 [Fusarium oxysporum f. sp. lycopersici 4287]EWZ79190.1 hypothetical protein FOWG_16639 [Fusarium oxysporum f. sp. lycopersici MN25]KAJ9413053.1 hypothetical protein QL093DRAFT_1129976 [Fusarium oxysporum]EWZ79191.1 hypothetical protein FOWG_16639 [Fusarium oxysporum f. sp. lycopersici MN25]KNB13814.1 hypothetical protein FOXG_12490 [Fusarium oxysporum f. sp. lycopersici